MIARRRGNALPCVWRSPRGARGDGRRRRRTSSAARHGSARTVRGAARRRSSSAHRRLRRQQLAPGDHGVGARTRSPSARASRRFDYADGQGNTQKAISDIQGMVAKGVNALVVFPDAGKAMLPALRSAYKAGVVTVPYRVNPGGKAGKDYDVWVGRRLRHGRRELGPTGSCENLPDGGNVLFLSGPAGNSQGIDERKGLHAVLDPTGKYTFIGEQPFEVTNWDPALTQQVLTAAIAKYPKIDVIVSDFGPSLVGALPEFEKSGRSIPALVTSDGNVLSCFWQEQQGNEPGLQAVHGRDAATTTPGSRSTGPSRWRPAARRRPRSSSRRRCSRTRSTRQAAPGHLRARPPGRHLPVRPDARQRPGRSCSEVGAPHAARGGSGRRRAPARRTHRGQPIHRSGPCEPAETPCRTSQPTLSCAGSPSTTTASPR